MSGPIRQENFLTSCYDLKRTLINKLLERKKLQENMLINLRDNPSVGYHGYSAQLAHIPGSSFLRQFCAPCYSCRYVTRIYVE